MDVLIMLEGDTLREFMRYMSAAEVLRKRDGEAQPYRLRIGVDAGEIKVKVNEYTWSAPLGVVMTGEKAQ